MASLSVNNSWVKGGLLIKHLHILHIWSYIIKINKFVQASVTKHFYVDVNKEEAKNEYLIVRFLFW